MFCLVFSCVIFGSMCWGGEQKYTKDFIDWREKCHFYHVYASLSHLKCGVFFVCPGSPFLASEDRVLGGVIVLRCCRCVEAPPSQNIQGILGKALIISSLRKAKIWLLIFKNPSSDRLGGGGGGTVAFLAGGLCFNLHNQALVSHPSSQIQTETSHYGINS